MVNFTTALVTYANRGMLVKQVVEACVAAGCDCIFIIDNGSDKESKDLLLSLKHRYEFIHLVENLHNLGSSVAFGQLMDMAVSELNPNEIVLFLDDDNVSNPNSLQNTIVKYSCDYYKNSVFFLYRKDRQHYVHYVETGDESLLTGRPNSFMTFTVSSLVKKIMKNNKKKLTMPIGSVLDGVKLIPIPCGPYGGMLSSKTILSQSIRPKKDMFVYFDDTDYTMRLKHSGIDLYLVTSCLLTDIDDSWTNEKLMSKLSSPLLEGLEYKVRFSLRNRVYFEKKHIVNNDLIYYTNMMVFLMILLIKALCTMRLRRYIKLLGYVYEGITYSKQ